MSSKVTNPHLDGLIRKWRREASEGKYDHPASHISGMLDQCAHELEAALAGAAPDDAAELSAWRELGRCVFLGLPTFPNEWPQDVSVIGYSLSMRHKAHAPAKAREVVIDDAMIERAARVICIDAGLDPNQVRVAEINGRDIEEPDWMLYDELARDVLTAALATFAEKMD